MPLGAGEWYAVVYFCLLMFTSVCCFPLLLFARNSSAGTADPVSLLLLYAFTWAG